MRPIRPTWQPSYESGHPQIDGEHRRLVEFLREIADALESGHAAPRLFELLQSIRNDCAAHFAREEEILRETRFPDFDGHSQIHASLLTKMTRLLQQQSGAGMLGMETLVLLFYDAIVLHMLIEDRKFFPYLSPAQRLS